MVATDPSEAYRAPHAVIATGTGRYADPWHPFPSTSARVADSLRADGWRVSVDEDVDHALAHLHGVNLLVVNAGDPWRDGDVGLERRTDAAADAGLRSAIDRGIGIIALHAALSTLRDHPAWRAAIGGEWEPGRSWHPPISHTHVRVLDGGHPVTQGLTGLDVYDERYAELVVDDDSRVLAEHDVEGSAHPAVWARERPTRLVVSSLGHDERAYDSPELVALLQRAARWAARI